MNDLALSKLLGRPKPGELTELELRSIIRFLQEKLQEAVSVKLSIDESPVIELTPFGFCANFRSIRETPGALIDPIVAGTIGLGDNGQDSLGQQIVASVHFYVNEETLVTHQGDAFLELKFNFEEQRWYDPKWYPDEFGEFDL